ncbi:(2Fe-2S)-binding protein [Occallatibacter riparius]|uniref:(2Fe-2S)-binding protein n=1 Tax=Occallatibacter riparius TaxID=1002689 RepID=A0A9J7BRV1_9BACT|nr:(2Fe-2S)-binding protein [Occallatibacter riparius]UWZ84498.1 (2Fe-2S)-binding protein [Occallatibacter riparius]
MSLKLTVNQKAVQVDASPDTPLLWVLRDHLDLKGAKFGCGVGSCGSCMVLVDSRPVRSCITPISAVANAKITTIEGLSPDGTHPIQKAWHEVDVPQCGYCQSGQIMAAVALLERTPKPTDEQIDTAMQGNLCRCGTYARVRRAIHRAAGQLTTDQLQATLRD